MSLVAPRPPYAPVRGVAGAVVATDHKAVAARTLVTAFGFFSRRGHRAAHAPGARDAGDVTDGSALPTQGAANPALTIMAEASPVAEVLDAKGPFRVARRRGARG